MYDAVSLSLNEGEGIVLDGQCGCPPEKNTAYRAAEAFFLAAAASGLSPIPGLEISITKGIPMGAGLGGGSSDAASTLAGLASLLPGFVDDASLHAIAASIGSDVPFFMDTACAAVTGRGEILSHLTPRTDFSLVVVDPGFPVSTKEAYARLDDSRSGARAPGGRSAEELRVGLDRAIREYASLPPSAWSFENDFFHAVARVHPDLVECRAALVSAGASFSAMSGSGSALFGVFEYLDVAERALEAISKAYSAVIAFPLARLRDSI